MRVVSYYNVVPAVNKSQEKFDILTKFITGVNAAGDEGILHTTNSIVEADVGVIQGWQHQQGKQGSHLQLRQRVIDTQLQQGKYVCTADSNLFLYANSSNKPWHYLRYSFNGVFPNTGIYFDDAPDPKRWQQISRDLNIALEPQKRAGTHIVVCLQRNGGWSMGRIAVVDWVTKTVNEIKKYTARPIVLRPHPGDKKSLQTYVPQLVQRFKQDAQVTVSSPNTPLSVDLNNAWAVVNHNSSAIVGPVIQGYHAFITDPERSQCAEIAHTDFSLLETPKEFDRQRWLERISMFHWKFSELEDGSAWRHMRDYVRQ
jgi:hypothetical protein